MAFALFRRARGDGTIRALYGAIVAQARRPAFYQHYGVPDTLDGRFDMIVLHLALVLRRLRQQGEAGRVLAQGVFDRFCADMDHNLRELGLSDTAVPRRMRRFGEAFYGRAAAYDRALDAGDAAALAAALARNMFTGEGVPPGASSLSRYVMRAEELLAAAPATLTAGRAEFPDPAAFRPPDAA